MMKTIIISSSVIIILLSVFVAKQLLTVSIKPDYSHFFLVLHWPGTEGPSEEEPRFSNPTTTTTIEKPIQEFKIHGLWPQPINPKTPQERLEDCDLRNPDKTPYNASLIKDLIPLLKKHWPAMESPSGSGEELWHHEWEKHGTCSKYVLNQHAYFKASLDLMAKVNLLQILENAKIIPDAKKTYSLGSIMKALSHGIGHDPGLECVHPTGAHFTNLYQVKICVNREGSEFIMCPGGTPPIDCKGMIKFPTFPSSEDDQL